MSGVSAAAGRRNGQFDRKRDFGLTASHTRIKKRISNTEYRMSNVEGRNPTRREPLGRTIIFMNLKDKATRGAHAAQALALRERLRCASDSILRNSAVCCSTQAPAAEAISLIGKEDFSLGESHTRVQGFWSLATGYWDARC